MWTGRSTSSQNADIGLAAGGAEQLFPATLVDRDAGPVDAEAVELVTALRSPPQ